MDVFMGTIIGWPISYAPDYFALCQGQSLPTNQYQALFSLIGTVFGGDTVNFKIPDLRGRALIGAGQAPGLSAYNMGNTVGSNTGSATISVANMPAHNHTAAFNPMTGVQNVTLPAVPPSGSLSVAVSGKVNTTTAGTAAPASNANIYLGGIAGKAGTTTNLSFTGPFDTTQAASTGNLMGLTATATPSANYNPGNPGAVVPLTMITNGAVSVGQTGGNQPIAFNNMQPSLAMNFLICLQGLYPVHP